MDEWTASKTPYVFIIDFDKQKPIIAKLNDLDDASPSILFDFPQNSNTSITEKQKLSDTTQLIIESPFEFSSYEQKFNRAIQLMKEINVQVINLTQPTSVELKSSLETIFYSAKAKYKVLLKDKFVCFSPEIFIRISADGIISTNPMKGTIDANLPNAETYILNSPKEIKEHTATVDLLKKDLELVADEVQVTRFRYIDRLTTSKKDLLQVSSEVSGQLKAKYRNSYGTLIDQLLPAGSILGTPKQAAQSIIAEVEGYKRGYYTGVCGVFDGETLDSCVLIRIIEAEDKGFYYKSGGGITVDSTALAEYEEIKNKIYVSMD